MLPAGGMRAPTPSYAPIEIGALWDRCGCVTAEDAETAVAHASERGSGQLSRRDLGVEGARELPERSLLHPDLLPEAQAPCPEYTHRYNLTLRPNGIPFKGLAAAKRAAAHGFRRSP